MGINLVAATIVACMFAIINYKIKMVAAVRPAAAGEEDEEEDI